MNNLLENFDLYEHVQGMINSCWTTSPPSPGAHIAIQSAVQMLPILPNKAHAGLTAHILLIKTMWDSITILPFGCLHTTGVLAASSNPEIMCHLVGLTPGHIPKLRYEGGWERVQSTQNPTSPVRNVLKAILHCLESTLRGWG